MAHGSRFAWTDLPSEHEIIMPTGQPSLVSVKTAGGAMDIDALELVEQREGL